MDASTTMAEPPTPTEARGGQTLCPPLQGYCDLLVVGETPAGAAAAREGQRRGLRVALVTEPQGVSTSADCLLRHLGREGAQPGRSGGCDTGGNAACFHDRLAQWCSDAGPRVARKELARLGIVLLEGQPTFVGPNLVEVDGREVRFRRAVLAFRGSAMPDPGGLPAAEPLRPDVLFGLDDLPRRAAILGSGPQACMWAQVLRRLRCDVILVCREPSILSEQSALAAAVVERQLAREGVQLLTGCAAVAVQQTGSQQMLILRRQGQQEKRFVDRVFRPLRSAPDLESLRLDRAGVTVSHRGIDVDDSLRTANRRIFAASGFGREFDQPQMAAALARFCAANAFRFFPRPVNRALFPRFVWTDPEIATVGLTPIEAAGRQIRIDSYRVDIPEAAATALDDSQEGFVIIYTRHRTGRILGATAVAERAGDLIGPLGLLIARGISLDELAEGAACLPSRLVLIAEIAEYYRRNHPRSRWHILADKLHARWQRVRRHS